MTNALTTEYKAAGSHTQCAYHGCTETPRVIRKTASGILAHYCTLHAAAAASIFGEEK